MRDTMKGIVWCISVLCSQLMRQMINRYSRLHVQPIAILLTDGVPGIGSERVIPEADEAKREHTKILVVGALR